MRTGLDGRIAKLERDQKTADGPIVIVVEHSETQEQAWMRQMGDMPQPDDLLVIYVHRLAQ